MAGRCHECPRIAIFGPPPAAAPILVSNSTLSADTGAAAGAGREDWSGPAPAADAAPSSGGRTRQAVGIVGAADSDGHVHAVGSGPGSGQGDSGVAASAAAAAAPRALLLHTPQPSCPMPTHGQGEKGKAGRKGTRGGGAQPDRAVHCHEHRGAQEVVLVGGICQVVSPLVMLGLCLIMVPLPVRVSIFGGIGMLALCTCWPLLTCMHVLVVCGRRREGR